MGLLLDSRLLLGGGGVSMPGSLTVPRGASGPAFAMELGYGGALVGYRVSRRPGWTVTAALFLGAGHAEARDLVVEAGVEADNFLLGVPEVTVAWHPVGWIGLTAGAGYRLTAGVDDLPGISRGALDGGTLTLGLHLGG